jgi:signal transduction histidine kinase
MAWLLLPSLGSMRVPGFNQFDLDIARARIVLSILAMISLYVDPSAGGGLFHLTPVVFCILLCHFAYSSGVYAASRKGMGAGSLPFITIVLDILFASAIAFLTEGQTGPSYVFFVFAIIAVGMRAGLAVTMRVTFSAVALYLIVVAASTGLSGIYVMRAVYLAIAGYLIGFFGQQRAHYEERLRELEAQAARHSIARSLHDSYVQSLVGVDLRLQTCRQLIRSGQSEEAANELLGLQTSVEREYAEVRKYIRTLAGIEATPTPAPIEALDPMVKLKLGIDARSPLAERILKIALEGLANARKHSHATAVEITATQSADGVAITIADDGVGFPKPTDPPWTIASHVAECGGRLNIRGDGLIRLEIAIPNAGN